MENIALDVHKRYTWARIENAHGERLYEAETAKSRSDMESEKAWETGLFDL